ncbi:MAG: DHH family phosphoesterase, partial [Pseudomonadales bacterium]|nr:DHH family phosphoesterase [Pseudomonadales bacterium]
MSKRLIRRKVDHVLGSSLINRLYAARGVRDTSELDLSLQHLLQPRLKDLERAADLIATSIIRQQKILIVGDFDADGATSTAMMVDVLRAMGGAAVEYLVPDRFEYGYGLTPEIVEVAARRQPDLLVTVDNGMSSIEGVALARARNIRVIITDHHLPGPQLPDADAIVNPNQPGCEFPGKALAGVGVAFYVLSAVRSALRDRNWFAERMITIPNLADCLDLVALGTVADLVHLDRNN